MSYFSGFPFVRIVFFFTIGIYSYTVVPMHRWMIFIGCLGLICWLVVCLLKKNSIQKGIFSLVLLVFLGYAQTYLQDPTKNPYHLIHCDLSVITAYEARVISDITPKSKSQSMIVEVQGVRTGQQWRKAVGKMILYFPITMNLSLQYEDRICIVGAPQLIPTSQNPQTFDYKHFLSLQRIHHQHFIQSYHFQKIGSSSWCLAGYMLKIKKYFSAVLTKYITHPQAYGIVLALVLGNKEALTFDLKTAYAGTGAMHILAVSGLHVGILFWMMSNVLQMIPFFRRSRGIYTGIILSFLWWYAVLTGLSPSVMRATTMFSFIILAKLWSRHTNIYNTLALSAFFLLFWDPYFLFSVGFQLSYLAVLGIVYLQPKIERLYIAKNFLMKKWWLLSTVSIAAQMATMPISLYYFHQLPTYFLLANWVVVPAAFWMMIGSFLVLCCSFHSFLHVASAFGLEHLILGVNHFIFWLSTWPYSQIKGIFLSKEAVFLIYGGLIFVLSGFARRCLQDFLKAGVIFLGLIFLWGANIFLQKRSTAVVIYSIPKHQAVAFYRKNKSIVWTDADLKKNSQKINYYIMPHQKAMGIMHTHFYALDTVKCTQNMEIQKFQGMFLTVFQGKMMVIIPQKIGPLPVLQQKIVVDFLFLDHAFPASLMTYGECFQIKQVIIGHRVQRKAWKKILKEAEKLKIVCHDLRTAGAWQYAGKF